MKVKTSVGEFDVSALTWKQIKEAGIYEMLQRFMTIEEEKNVMGNVSDGDIERVVRIVVGDKIEEMTLDDVIEVFNAVLTELLNSKK